MSGRLAGLPAASWALATSLLLAGRQRQSQPGGARDIIAGNSAARIGRSDVSSTPLQRRERETDQPSRCYGAQKQTESKRLKNKTKNPT